MDIEAKIAQVESQINAALEELGPTLDMRPAKQIIEQHLPTGWEYAEITTIGGAPQICITRVE